jgi:hypothetical protein
VRGGRSEGLRRREGLCDSVREAGGQFCKYARGGSNKIRDRSAPGIGAIYITRNRPVTSPNTRSGRGGSGRVGSDRAKIVIPNNTYMVNTLWIMTKGIRANLVMPCDLRAL